MVNPLQSSTSQKKHSLSFSIPRKLITLPVYELFFLRNVTPKPANADFPPSVGDARPPPSFGNGCVQHSLPRPRPFRGIKVTFQVGKEWWSWLCVYVFSKYMILDIELRISSQMITQQKFWDTSDSLGQHNLCFFHCEYSGRPAPNWRSVASTNNIPPKTLADLLTMARIYLIQ